jgi:hypothetical protein
MSGASLCPIRSIQRSVLNRLRNMLGLDLLRLFHISHDVGDTQGVVMGVARAFKDATYQL